MTEIKRAGSTQFNTAANTFSRHHGSSTWEDNLFLRFYKVVNKEKDHRKDAIAAWGF